jgi:hypothetical protein
MEPNTQITVQRPFESSLVKGGKLQVAYKQYQDYLNSYEKKLMVQQSKRADLYQ